MIIALRPSPLWRRRALSVWWKIVTRGGCCSNTIEVCCQAPGGQENTTARLCFADFSSAFNSVRPHVLARRLSKTASVTICWLVDFLTSRPQRARVNETMSETLMCSTGSPQGCVLLYNNDCKSMSESRFTLKFTDGSVIVRTMRWATDRSLTTLLDGVMTPTCNLMKSPVAAQTFVRGAVVVFRHHPGW